MSDALERVYERRLLGMARDACERSTRMFTCARLVHDLFTYTARATGGLLGEAPEFVHQGPNLADALAALLRDLGVEDVPERVSAEEVREAREAILSEAQDQASYRYAVEWVLYLLRDLYASGNRGALLAESILAVGL